MARLRRQSALVLWLLCAAGAWAADDLALEVIDDSGTAVSLRTPVDRIVALSPNTVELVFAAGAGERLVAVSEFSDYPERAKVLPTVASGSGIDYEAVIAYQPDLVLAWLSGNGPPAVRRLRQLGLTVWALEPTGLSDIARWLRLIGRAAGNAEEGERVAQAYLEDIERIRSRYAGRPARSVLVEIGQRPLMTLSGRHIVSQVIEICGGRHLFAELAPITPLVEMEAVYAEDPDLILQFDEQAGEECLPDPFWSAHPALTAVGQNRVCQLPGSLLTRHGTRLAEGARRLCAMINALRGD